MEDLNPYKKARAYFKVWAPERRKVLFDLKIIRNEITRQAGIHCIGSITYSSLGLVGGGLAFAGIVTAPFAFGAFIGLTVAGIATGVTSGVAGLTHGVVKFRIVKSLCNSAIASLENHDATCKKMKELLKVLKIKLFTETLTVFAAVRIIVDFGSLTWNPVKNIQVCSEAEKLDKVIQNMEHEYDVLNKYFKS